MNNTSLHWTEDPGLLEQFVLDRIPRERLAVLNEHLNTCDQCRKAVEREKNFVQSVKAYGRERLRARLKEKLEYASTRAVPWPHVLSAAAIVVLVVGLGIYNRWWREPDLVQSEEQVVREKDEQGPPAPAAAEAPQTAGVEDELAKPSAGAENRLLGGEIASERGKEKKQLDMAIRREEDLKALAGQRAQAITGGEKATGKVGGGEYWVEGVLIDMSVAGKSGHVMAREDADAAEPKKDEARKEAVSAQQGKYLLQQQPGTALPMVQQQLRKVAVGVPTKVEPTNDGAILTAYTDQFDLRNKQVQGQFVGIDSLVFIVDGVRIAYRLPPAPVKQ